MTPLTARTYLESYHDHTDPGISADMVPIVNEFKAWDVIPVETLRDTWPVGKWEGPEAEQSVVDEVSVPQLENLETSTPDTSKTPSGGNLGSVLQAPLDGRDDNTGLLSEGELLNDFLPKLKEKLYQQSGAVEPAPHILDLLCRALEKETDVDLSPFTCFSAEDMSLVVSRLRKRGKMHTLCISNRSDLTPEDLQVVLRDAAGLKAVYVLENPQLPAHGMSSLLKDCDFYNSELLRQAIKPEPVTVPVGQVCEDNNILQLVWIGVSAQQAIGKSYRLGSGQFDWETLRQENLGLNFGCFEDGLKYKRYPLDIPLPTFRAVAGLLCLVQWSSSFERMLSTYDVEQFSRGAALSFALASSIEGDKKVGISPLSGDREFGIGPLVPGLYRDRTYKPSPSGNAHEHLEPGKWAVILIHEAHNAPGQISLDEYQWKGPIVTDSDSEVDKPFRAIKRLRYALVTPCTEPQASGHNFIVADIPTFLQHIMAKSNDEGRDAELKKLVEAYNSGIAAMDTVDLYRDEDVHDILTKVFPRQKAILSSSKPE